MIHLCVTYASLMKKSVKNLPTMQETWARSLGWDDHLEEGILQYSCLENPRDRGAWWAAVHEVASVGHDLVTKPPPKCKSEWRPP